MSKKKQDNEHEQMPKFDCVRVRGDSGRTPVQMPLAWPVMALAIVVLAAAAWLFWPERNYTPVAKPKPPPAKPFVMEDEKTVFGTYAGSATCKACHAAEYDQWIADLR